ncbi:MAG: DegT/DnrJ/EryC1/StrS family aminotransferase [Candidatus Hydrogenedentes bacterium]|nr:DegT/DnrJ/EryC1/StrS family aminotransferase [Candidatus Hydrogenedentota bacterium]
MRGKTKSLTKKKPVHRTGVRGPEKLALQGGPKSLSGTLPPWPWFDAKTIRAVSRVLRSGKVNYWTGPLGMEFERKFAEWNGSKFAISTTNGTSALHTALAGLGIGPGDEVIVPSYTFIASSFSIVQAGAIPRFADVNREDHCLSVQSARRLINDRTRAIMVVHLYGNVVNMDPILALARNHNLYVIEDNAEAYGGVYKGRKTGSIGDMGACSFCQNKTFTTGGEGGMVTTDNEEVAWRCRSFRDHGYDVRERLRLLEMEQKLPYIHKMVGWNYRMTEMQSTIGLCELERIDAWNMPRRRRNAAILMEALREIPQILYLPVDTPERRNGWYVFPITLDMERMRCDMAAFLEALGAEGVPCWKVFWPQCHTERAFTEKHGFGNSGFPFTSREYTDPRSAGYRQVEVPNALWHQARTFITFLFPTYEVEHMEGIARGIKKVIAAFAK